MKTQKLYDIDSHLSEFSATVLECNKTNENFEIILDKTAFFPEGGGQPADTGFIALARVNDVQIKNGCITHFCNAAVPVGEEVVCKLDWEQRFRRMQNHSGEHIVSGIAHRLFDCENVGFHMGEDVTVDFDKELTDEQLEKIEQLANEAIYKNVRFICEYPDESTLKTLEYRSKLELTENVRIVTIEGYDVCACCAPHVERSGEIGIIKLLDSSRHRGGIRLHLLCGADAVEDYVTKYKNLHSIALELCTKQNETSASFQRLMAEHGELKMKIAALQKEITTLKAAKLEDCDENVLIFERLEMNDLRKLVLEAAKKTKKLCAGFSGSDTEGYRFAIASEHLDLRTVSKPLMQALSGKGGGSAELIQGSLTATEKEIRKYFETL